MKKLILFAAVFGIALSSEAQLRFGPEAGFNISGLIADAPGTDASGVLPGAKLGGIADIQATRHLYVQPGLFFSMKGGQTDGIYTFLYQNLPAIVPADVTTRVNYIEVPVNVVYKLNQPDEGRYFFHAGPYVGFAISGNSKYELDANTLNAYPPSSAPAPTLTRSLNFGDGITDDMKGLDVGFNAGLGYESRSGFLVRANYGMSVVNLAPIETNDLKNWCIGISVGYIVGKRFY